MHLWEVRDRYLSNTWKSCLPPGSSLVEPLSRSDLAQRPPPSLALLSYDCNLSSLYRCPLTQANHRPPDQPSKLVEHYVMLVGDGAFARSKRRVIESN